MTRLSDRLVVQKVDDDRLVLVDDERGTEIVFSLAEGRRLAYALPYLTDGAYVGRMPP